MTLFGSIVVPLDGSVLAARGLSCALWVASRLQARVHVVAATAQARPPREELVRLRVPEEHWPAVTLHQVEAVAESAILQTLAAVGTSLVVMSAGGRSAEAGAQDATAPIPLLGHVARAVIEGTESPVLLLPPRYEERLPWRRALVPLSGQVEADAALALAVRLAQPLQLRVHVVHVEDEPSDEGLAAQARYADALHHEYARQLEEIVGRALPHAGPDERRLVAEVALCRGDTAAELLAFLDERQIDLVAIGWRGQFMTGRAPVLKRLLGEIRQPVLLVKPGRRAASQLKVGEAFLPTRA